MAPDNENDLNEQIEQEIEDAGVITVPIDATLKNSGEAADAKAVGDALALKADKTELQTAIQVNGQSADAQGKIIVTAADTKMASDDQTTVKEAIEAVDGKTGEDIYLDDSNDAQTIAQAIENGVNRTADQIAMSGSDQTTVKSAIDSVSGNLSTLAGTVAQIGNRTGANIPYAAGSEETIKEHVDALEAGKVKTVNEVGPDADGNIELERVPLADNLYTEDGIQVDGSFLIRTTGGSGSLSDGGAWAQKMLGNRTHTGYVAESINMAVAPEPRTAPAAITASIDNAAFETAAGTAGTYAFNYTTAWDTDPTDYGITVSNTPISGDKITVVWDGENDPVMTVDAEPRTAPAAITATISRDTWVAEVSSSGTYTFAYSTAWKLSGEAVDMADYGITVSNTPIAGDQIVVVYVKEVRGTITQATPTALVGTGWNLYNHTNGYARVTKYSNDYGYAISGTYTAIAFAETPTGTQTAITPDEDGLFNVTGDGYIIVTGGNSSDTAIWATWSDWTEGYSGSWEAYSESKVNLFTLMGTKFPYGLMRVGDVRDEIDFVHKQTISRISREAYSAEARAAAAASGRGYEFDEDYIYLVRETEVIGTFTLDEEYTVSEHGLEWFEGSSIEVYAEILYGSNLKDKLKRDVLTISEQVLTSDQKSQARDNIGAAPANITGNDIPMSSSDSAKVKAAIENIEGSIAHIVGNTNSTGAALAVGDYVYVTGHSTIPDGLRKVTSVIASGVSITTSNTSAVSGGIGSEVASLNSKLTIQYEDKQVTSDSDGDCDLGSTNYGISKRIVIAAQHSSYYSIPVVISGRWFLRTTNASWQRVTNTTYTPRIYYLQIG